MGSLSSQKLPWFERRTGQPLDEVLKLAGSYRLDSLVVAIDDAIRTKGAEVSEAERTVLAVEALEREVNSGGYSQFFFNAGEYSPVIVDSLHAIGCPTTAGLTSEAIRTLGLRPGYTKAQIRDAAARSTAEDDARLDALDDRFYEYAEPIAERLFAYIGANRQEIVLP